MQCGTITLTTSNTNHGNFDLLSDVDGYNIPFVTGLARSQLLAPGYYTELIPDGASIIRIQSDAACTNYVDVTLTPIPSPTPTPSVTPLPTILTSMGATTVDTSTADEYDAYTVVNHTPHQASQIITMTFNYDITLYVYGDYADVTLYYRKTGIGWQTVDGAAITFPTTSYTSTSGSFSVPNVADTDIVEVRAHHYIGTPGSDETYVSFYTTGGSVTTGYGSVSQTAPTTWDSYIN